MMLVVHLKSVAEILLDISMVGQQFPQTFTDSLQCVTSLMLLPVLSTTNKSTNSDK